MNQALKLNLNFLLIAAFLPHLLWLESVSQSKKSNRPTQDCICRLCEKVRKAVSQDDKLIIENVISSTALLHSKKISLSPVTKKSPSLKTKTKKSTMKSTTSKTNKPVSKNTSNTPSSSSTNSKAKNFTPKVTGLLKSPSNTPKTVLLYPMTKVLIESPDTNEYYPPNFTIPLPKLKKGDESILLNSRKK